jgi:hypothetical protein
MSVFDVRVLAEAADDMETGANFYDAREPGVGDDFWDSLLDDIESLELYAGMHAKQRGYYRMLAKRFPYAVYYRMSDDIVYVVGVLPLRRDPKWIARQLRKR